MERELGISYPTVRARVEALVRALGFGPRDAGADADDDAGADDAVASATATADAVASGRRAILERLSRKEMSAEEAASAIRELGRTR